MISLKYILFIIIIILFLAISTKPETIRIRKKSVQTRVVCSLTTRPKPPHYFDKVLDSLVKQFDAVYLALPKISCRGVNYPEFSYPGVTIVHVEKDMGPITKFFGILNSNEPSNTLAVVLDDDIIYDSKIRACYEREHSQTPQAVLSGSGIVYKYPSLELPWFLSMTGRRESFPGCIPSFLRNNHLTTVAGYAGICFRKNLVNRNELLDFIRYWNKDNDCFRNDDIVISAFFASKGISRLSVRIPRCKSESDKSTESISDVGNIGMMIVQHKVYQRLRDCFRGDAYRIDCLCGLDLLMIFLVTYVISRYPKE